MWAEKTLSLAFWGNVLNYWLVCFQLKYFLKCLNFHVSWKMRIQNFQPVLPASGTSGFSISREGESACTFISRV